jgi:hypothetical protein
VLARYDYNRDGKLTPSEIGLDESAFRNFDTSSDGVIAGVEITNLGQLPRVRT